MEKILDNEYRKQRLENMEKLKDFGYIPYNESFERSDRLDKLQKEFEIGKFNEEKVGELFSYFILETIIIGKLLRINPYDQPAVEQVKIYTKKYLK